MHKGRCSFVAIERASFAFTLLAGLHGPRPVVIAAVLFIFWGVLPAIWSVEGARVYFEKGIEKSFSGLGISCRHPAS